MSLIAYHGKPSEKSAILKTLRGHRKADEIIKGQYWEDGKGCAVGCTIKSGRHVEYETRFGIPEMLARLEDVIFEGLPNDAAKNWPVQFMSAIPSGADLSCVGWQFLYWVLTDKEVNPGIDHPLVRDAVRRCADVLAPMAKGKKVDASAAWSAASAAESAAWSAARSAAWSAESAAESAAWSAESAAWSAARSAAESAARSAARSAESAAESAAWSAASAAWSAASAAESAAWSAESAAWSAARSAAESAARSAARSAESAAESAAWSAASAARSAAYVLMSKRLLSLLKAAPKAKAVQP